MPTQPQHSAKEEHLLHKAKTYLNQSPAFVVREAHGGRFTDFSGKEYLDFNLGSGPMFLGHDNPAVTEAVRDYLGRGSHYYYTNEPSILLAEEIVKAVPCADSVRLTVTGNDATFYAMRVCRAFTGKSKVLKFEGMYHGMSDYGSASSWMGVHPATYPDLPEPFAISSGIPSEALEQMLIAPFNDLARTKELIYKHRDELAAVIVEPLQRNVPPLPGFLEGLRETTKQLQIPLIFDEVFTGFRFSYGGAQQYYGVTPDICALSKIVGGGHPLSAIAGRREIMEHFAAAPGRQSASVGGTMAGYPVGAVAGLATLRELKKPGTYEAVAAKGRSFMERVRQEVERSELEAQVIGEPFVFEVFFTKKPITTWRSGLASDAKLFRRFEGLLQEAGVVKAARGFCISVAHTEKDITEAAGRIGQALRALKTEGA